jgi:hypothetical protein
MASLGHAVSLLARSSALLVEKRCKPATDLPMSYLAAGWVDLGRPHFDTNPLQRSCHLTVIQTDSTLRIDSVGPEAVLSPAAWSFIRWSFHLPALRTFWRRELRSARQEALSAIIPRLWFQPNDAQAAPVGAVIDALGTSEWPAAPQSGLQKHLPDSDLGQWWEKHEQKADSQRYLATYVINPVTSRVELTDLQPQG